MKPSPSETQPSAEPALFRDTPPKRRHYAGSWSADEKHFAELLRNTWNAAFKGRAGPRCNNTHHNNFVAVQLHRWLHSTENARLDESTPPMTEADVVAAIKAYAASEWHNRKGFWMPFGKWLATGEAQDRIDAINNGKRGAVPDDAGSIARRKFARHMLDSEPWFFGDLARRAAQNKQSLHAFARVALDDYTKRPNMDLGGDRRKYFSSLLGLIDAFRHHPSPRVSVDIPERARTGFIALYGREPHTTDILEANTYGALTLALFAREPAQSASSAKSADDR